MGHVFGHLGRAMVHVFQASSKCNNVQKDIIKRNYIANTIKTYLDLATRPKLTKINMVKGKAQTTT